MTIEDYLLVKVQIVLYLVVVLLAASAFADISGFVLIEFKINTNYARSVYDIVSLPIFLLGYYRVTEKKKRIFILIATGYMLLATINVLFIQKQQINSYSSVVKLIILIICCLYYFYW